MNEFGHVRLALQTFFGSASVHHDRALAAELIDPAPFLNLLCNMHRNMLHLSGASVEAFPELTVHLENFAPHSAFTYKGGIVLNEARFQQALQAFKRGRISYTLLHEAGHVIQHLLGLSSENTWPAFTEGTATILGLQISNMMYVLPGGRSESWKDEADCSTVAEFAASFVQNGLRHIQAGAAGNIGLLESSHGPAPQILEAALFDLAYNQVGSTKPLRDAFNALKKSVDAAESGTPRQRFETFFQAFGESAEVDMSAYLNAWKFEVGGLATQLARFKPLEGILPVIEPEKQPEPEPDAVDHAATSAEQRAQDRRPEASFSQIGVEPLTVALGSGAATELLGAAMSEAVLDRFKDVRNEIARQTGIVVPGVHLRDDIYLKPFDYQILVRDTIVLSGELRKDHALALGNSKVLTQLNGDETHEPVYGLDAKWIAVDDVADARSIGAMVFDLLSVLASHVGQAFRDHLALVFGRHEFTAYFDHLRKISPALAKDLEETLPAYTLHKAIRLLLRESVWPRDTVRTFETFLDVAQTNKDPMALAEGARSHLVPALLRRKKLKEIRVSVLAPEFETACCAFDGALLLDPQLAAKIKEAISFSGMPNNQDGEKKRRTSSQGDVLLCTSALRPTLADFLHHSQITAHVYALSEIPADINVNIVTVISNPNTSEAETTTTSAHTGG